MRQVAALLSRLPALLAAVLLLAMPLQAFAGAVAPAAQGAIDKDALAWRTRAVADSETVTTGKLMDVHRYIRTLKRADIWGANSLSYLFSSMGVADGAALGNVHNIKSSSYTLSGAGVTYKADGGLGAGCARFPTGTGHNGIASAATDFQPVATHTIVVAFRPVDLTGTMTIAKFGSDTQGQEFRRVTTTNLVNTILIGGSPATYTTSLTAVNTSDWVIYSGPIPLGRVKRS
jgi:hypothetical protein